MTDIEGVEIKEGQTLYYSSYTPFENKEEGIVYVNDTYGGLWVNAIPVALLSHNKEYRKLKVAKNGKI